MNENERLAKIENELDNISEGLEEIKKSIKEINHWLVDLNSRVVAREVLNGEFKSDIADLQAKFKDLDSEIDVIKKAAWIGFGVIATLQFVIPLILQLWR